jgi:Na+/melibiose symporter-like transporter
VTGIVIKAVFSGFEKRAILRVGLILWISFYFVLSMIYSFGWYVWVAAALMGIGLGVSLTIPIALINDVADVAEHQLGERFDGIIFGSQNFFNKFLLGLLVGGFQLALQFTGYEKDKDVTIATELAIRGGLMLPALILFITYWANGASKLNNAEMERIAAELKARKNPRRKADDDVELLEMHSKT